jgi:ATP-dependent helicase/nuclease subunit B
MNLRVLTAHPSELEPALARELASLREQDSLAPISILVGGSLLRPYLRRRLAELSGGHINVHLLTPGELGLRLAEPRLIAAGRRPLAPLADRALVHEVAREAGGYFAPVKDAPGFAEVLGRLFRELRGALISSAALSGAVGEDGHPKHAELAALYARYCEARAPFYDGEDCIAALEPEDGGDLATLVFGVWQMQPALRCALEYLADRAPVTMLLPQTGTKADSVHAELRAWLDAHDAERVEHACSGGEDTALSHMQRRLFGEDEKAAPDATVRLLSAPDPNREAREAVRACLGWARAGIPLYDIAIVCRNPDTYRQSVESACREAGIALYIHSGTHITERPLGRQALALLDLIDSDLPRAALMELLTELRLPDATWERLGGILSATWDSISRKAGVVRGLEQWRERLSLYIEGQRGYEQEQGDEQEDAASHTHERVDAASSLLRFVEELAERFAARPESATWSVHIAYLGSLLGDYVKGSEQLVESLEALGELDMLGERVSFDRFRAAVAATIEGLRVEDVTDQRPAAFARRGVNLLDVNSLRHLRFGAVVVLGLTERAFPPPARQDPLLLDQERESLAGLHGWELPLRAHGADPEPLQFAMAVCAARERLVLSFARAEESGGRAKLPSSFFRAAAQALTGERVTADEVDLLDGRFFERAGASRIGASTLDGAFSAEDYDRTLLEKDRPLALGALSRARPAFARSRSLSVARHWTRTLTPYDGALGSGETLELLASTWGEQHALSPTGLEGYATCPYRFFLEHVLGIRSVEEPEEVERISAADRGTLIHAVLRRFLDGASPQRPAERDRAAQLKELMAIATEECDSVEQRGLTGYPLLWRHDREEILADLAGWYQAELEDPDRPLYDEADFEVRFGPARPGEQTGRLSRDQPIMLDLGGTHVVLQGRVDRLEWHTRERFRVIDYKTGSSRGRPKDNALGGGRSLQLPLYMIAAAELLAIPTERGSAQYFYSSRRGGFRRARFDGAELGDDRDGVRGLLRKLVKGMRAGDFHPEPSDGACRYCDFDSVCDAARKATLERKGGDRRVERFLQRGEEYP